MLACDSEGTAAVRREWQMTQREPLHYQEQQLEIVELLDERFCLREDPSRSRELEGTHARLRATLRRPSRGHEGVRGQLTGGGLPDDAI
jgi:hypothetical protein